MLSPDCSVLVSMNFDEVIFFYLLDSLLLCELSDFLEVIVALFIDNLSEVRLDFQPLVVLDDDHSDV